ncbi:Hypothetical protein R9X50_00449500 [Acrodontium crateriforme]|uniref:Uncharacterized protein n=1 Tax=Acrodontium crateriforme TaxID=150365 RepID=A0AAQ3M5G0_9PEZI|nr:Hypothetical protein R9X50_00449500 [Acrodontium crateriforme]
MAILTKDAVAAWWARKRQKFHRPSGSGSFDEGEYIRQCQKAYMGTESWERFKDTTSKRGPPPPHTDSLFSRHESNVYNFTTTRSRFNSKRIVPEPDVTKDLPPLPLFSAQSSTTCFSVKDLSAEECMFMFAKCSIVNSINGTRRLEGVARISLDSELSADMQRYADSIPDYPSTHPEIISTANPCSDLEYEFCASSARSSGSQGTITYSASNYSAHSSIESITSSEANMPINKACAVPIYSVRYISPGARSPNFEPGVSYNAIFAHGSASAPQAFFHQQATSRTETRALARLISEPEIGALTAAEAWCSGKYQLKHDPHLPPGMRNPPLCSCSSRAAFDIITEPRWKTIGVAQTSKSAGSRWIILLCTSSSRQGSLAGTHFDADVPALTRRSSTAYDEPVELEGYPRAGRRAKGFKNQSERWGDSDWLMTGDNVKEEPYEDPAAWRNDHSMAGRWVW